MSTNGNGLEPLAVDFHGGARMTSLSAHTLRSYARKGILKVVKAGRRTLIPIESLRALVANGAPSRTKLQATTGKKQKVAR